MLGKQLTWDVGARFEISVGLALQRDERRLSTGKSVGVILSEHQWLPRADIERGREAR